MRLTLHGIRWKLTPYATFGKQSTTCNSTHNLEQLLLLPVTLAPTNTSSIRCIAGIKLSREQELLHNQSEPPSCWAVASYSWLAVSAAVCAENYGVLPVGHLHNLVRQPLIIRLGHTNVPGMWAGQDNKYTNASWW